MKVIKRAFRTATIAIAGSLALIAPESIFFSSVASAATGHVNARAEQYSDCGDIVHTARSGKSLRISIFSGDIKATIGNQYGTVQALLEKSGTLWSVVGPYKVSPYGGASFTLTTPTNKPTWFQLRIVGSTDHFEYCRGNYFA